MSTYHLYSDGSLFPRAKKSGFGGYIVDPLGQVIVEYSEQIKQAEYIHNFELLGIIRGLQIAKDKGIDNIVSHCDDKDTAFKLKEIFEGNIFKVTQAAKPELYKKIMDISKSFKKIKFEYIPRAQNKYADSLSRRYADLMEKNYLTHYENELNQAENKLENKGKLPKRMFFSNPKLIRSPNKNSPFLVAPIRNKKVRKLSRLQETKDYKFLYVEAFMDDKHHVFRSFQYNNNHELEVSKETKIDIQQDQFANLCQFFSDSLSSIKHDRVWAYSNHRDANAYFEQKEKIPNDYSDSFHLIFDTMNQFKEIYFNHFPFKHKFSPEILLKEIKKEKINENLDNLEELMEQLSVGILGKEQNKSFGNLIRYNLRTFQQTLERELEEHEKTAIIEKTTDDLTKLGYRVPQMKK